jgi:hypothetical protein
LIRVKQINQRSIIIKEFHVDDSGVLSIINQVTNQGQATAALPAVLSQAAQSGTTPDQEAEWQRLAKESNVPVGLIRNGAPIKLMQLQQQGASLPATNPVTARTLMDPDNAAVAHDDIGTLTRLEDLAKNGFVGQGNGPVSALQFGTARDQAEANYFAREYGTKPFQAIQGGTGKLVTKLAFPVAAAVDAVDGNDDYKEFASQLYDAFSDIQRQSAAAPEQGFGGKLFRSLEELAPMVLSGGAGLGNIVGQAVNDKYDDLTAKGVDPDTATALALKAGMSAYAMTKLPFGGTSLSNSLVRGALLNPAFGVLDRALDKAGLNYVGYDQQADAINLKDPEQIAHDMALGLLFGAQHAIETGRPMMGDGLMDSLLPFYDQYQAGRRADALTEIGRIVQDSKVNNRAPDLVQQHLSDVAAEHAGIDNAYVPVNRWNELFQSAGLDPAAVADQMLTNPEAYHEANKTGSDIVIPFGEFTGKLSSLDQYGELVKDAKLSLWDTSLREAEAHAQAVRDNADNAGGFIDTLKNMFARSQEAVKGNESYGKVYDDLVGQQLGIGTERSTAEHNAQLVANAFRVMGDRAGVDPYELYSNYNLKLARPMDAAPPDRISVDRSIPNQKNIADAKENISELYDLAIGTTNENRKIDIAPVPDWKVKAVADAVAIDGYRHQVDTYSIRHTLRQHGDSVRELKSGQLRITKDDILSIPETVLSPDSIAYGVKNGRGQDLIASVKRMPDGTLLLVEEARTGRKTLSMASVRKYPAAKDSDSVARTLLSNARSDGGNPKIKIVQPEDNVKRDIIRPDGNSADSKLSDVTVFLQSSVNRLAADGVRELYQSGKPPVSEITGKELSDYLDADNVMKEARAYFRENLQDRVVSRDGFGDVRVRAVKWENVKWALKTNLLKAQLIPAIPDIIKNGEYLGRENLSRKRKGDVVAFHFLVGDVLLDGKRIKTGVAVAEDSGGNLIYNFTHDTDALWVKSKAPLLPGSEAGGAEPSRGDESSALGENIPNAGDRANIKIIDIEPSEATAATTPPNNDDHVKKVVTGVLHSAITRIETPADAAHIAFPLTKRAQEAAIAIVTDADGNVLGVVQHSTGSLNSTIMSPRDLLGVVHDFPGAAEVWFAHNHPSGDPTTSRTDREITSSLTALLDGSAIKSRGMIVVGQEGGAVWTKGKGDRSESISLSSLNTDKERTREIKTYEREIVKLPSSNPIAEPAHVINYARSFGDGDSGIIILNSQMKPVSFIPMSLADMAKLKTGDPATGSSSIMSAFHKGNGASMIMIVPTVPGSLAAARNVAAFGNMLDAPLGDVIYAGNGLSFNNTGRMPEILNRFYQGGDVKRGYIRFDSTRNFEIGLLKDANLSTFIHESGHFFTEVLGDLAERPDAPRQIKDDYAALLRFAGVESRDAIQAEHHEKLARAFEAYIREGNAPSAGMHSVFQRMKAWMIGVYKDMTALDVQLTPEVRDVFDRMLATDTEIGRMRAGEDMKPLFATAEDAGMSPAEFERYRNDAEQAGELAKEQLLRKLMAEKDREQKSWWKDERNKTWAGVEGEAKDDAVYRTYQVLTTGKTFDGRDMGDIKLSRPDLVKMYGEDFVKKLPREFQRVYSKEGGLHPDAVAEMAGFGSGDEMVRKMAGAPKLKDYVKAETDRRMRERHGDMMADGSIHEQALKDVHNDAQAKVVLTELRAIRRKAGEAGPNVKATEERGTADATTRTFPAEGRVKAARDRAGRNAMLESIPPVHFFRMTASETMGAKRVADIQPHLYAHAAGKAAQEASEAAAKGDYRRAGEAKYRELLNHYLYREADRAKDFTDKVQAYAAKMGSGKELGKFVAGSQFLDQIRAILDRYGFGRTANKEADARMEFRESLDAFLRRMKNEEGVELPIPDVIRQEIQRTNYRNLSMDGLRGVYDSVRMLEHAARQITQVNAGGRKVEVAEAALSLSNMLLRSTRGAADMARGSDGAGALLNRVKDVGLDIPVLLPEFMFGRFDGLKKTGPWHEFIRDRYNDAVDHQIGLRDMIFPKIMEYAHGNDIDRSMGKIHIDSLNADLVKDDIIAIALNCGNGSNLDELMRGGLRFRGDEAPTPLDSEALQEILTHLSATEIDVVNGIWKTIDLLKPEAAESARKRTGVEPNWIGARPMEVKNGTLEGGYYPVKYDPRYGVDGETPADSSMLDRMFNKYATSTTRQGYLKERGAFAVPLSLDWQSIVSRHLDEVITEISHGQFVTDTRRLLKRPEVKDAFNDRLGSAYYKNLLDWVGYTVNQDDVSPEVSDDIEKFRRQIRNNMSTYALGFKVANALNEMAVGIPPMMKQVKIASAFKGIMQFMRNPVEATRFATQAGEYMRNIDKSLDRDIAQALHPLAGPHGVADDIRQWSIAARTFIQKIGVVMAWHAGYIDAQEQGLQGDAAVRNADSVCRMTQGTGRGGDASVAPRDTDMKELARFIGPTMKDYLGRAGINPDSMNYEEKKAVSAALGGKDLYQDHKAWHNVQKAQEWLAVLQPTVSDRIAKILKPSQNIRPFSNDAVKQSGEQVYYQSVSHASDRIATDIDPATVSMRKYPATTRAESILSSLGPNVRNDGRVSDLQVVESPVSVKANDANFQAGLATLLAGYVANAMISGITSGKETDKLDKLPSWILARLTLGLFDGFPLMRDMDGYAESGITGGKGNETRPSSVLQWSKDAVDGFTKTVEATTGDGGWNRTVMHDAKTAGGATGLPAQAGSTIGRYIYDVLSGDYTPEHPWSQVIMKRMRDEEDG